MRLIATPFVLSDADLAALNQLVAKGKDSVRKLNRARALQFSHQDQSVLGSTGPYIAHALPQ